VIVSSRGHEIEHVTIAPLLETQGLNFGSVCLIVPEWI
jgi:hypothetical protein